MLNEDLIGYLQPVPSRLNPNEWRDVCGAISDIEVDDHRFLIRAHLPAGLYRCKLETRPGAFPMKSLMMMMVQAPDGKQVQTGPWDLDHFQNVMAVPMARTYVNGRLIGGMWFAMPGPDQIAANQLWADFGFEVEDKETELVLEFVEHDHGRIKWGDIRFMELRKDDRVPLELRPKSRKQPRVYLDGDDVKALRKRLPSTRLFQETVALLKSEELVYRQQCQLDLAALVYLLIRDQTIGRKLKKAILDLCSTPTWSARPDPLLMGGDNDREIGSKLFYTALAREYAFDLFDKRERKIILDRVDEYLRKIYEFTVLQRAYMGCPSPDAHTLGTWAGVGVACMCFYDDLASARKALPFFHGLYKDSLALFPPSGKTQWATYYPMHLVRYLAAAHTFGGKRPELDKSPYLDRAGAALLTYFDTPNAQELGRGLRTHEHRFLTAYLSRFHRTKGIDSIYQAFVEQERKHTGKLFPTLYDLLYAPTKPVKPAKFPSEPLFSRETGDVVCIMRGEKTVGCQLNAGLRAGRRVSFSLLPHNRELGVSLAQIDVSVDGKPVLINLGGYSLDSSSLNTMCFEDGAAYVHGQWLCGNIGPEASTHVRRCFINDRFVYAHAVITAALHPKYGIRQAERILLIDHRTRAIVLADSFEGTKPLRFGTHLHCSGSIAKLNETTYRLTGGQAALIAGKGRALELGNEERGEIFASILGADHPHQVILEEARWIPSYGHGLNFTGKEDFTKARFPHFQRWRLEATSRVDRGRFLVALSAEPGQVSCDGNCIAFPDAGLVYLTENQRLRLDECECVAEAVLADKSTNKTVAIGARSVTVGRRVLEFSVASDVELSLGNGKVSGIIHSRAIDPVARKAGFKVAPFRFNEDSRRTTGRWTAEVTAS